MTRPSEALRVLAFVLGQFDRANPPTTSELIAAVERAAECIEEREHEDYFDSMGDDL